MKKNLFLLPSIILIFFLCFTTLSCFSGFLEEKGQVTLTFSESSLHNLMARGAVSEEAENDFDFLSDFPNKPKIEYQFYGFEGQFTDIEDFDEEDFDLANAYVLNFYEDSAYEVYSAALLSELAKEYEGMFDNVSDEDIFKNPDFQEMLKDPYAFYEKAIVSKGNWSKSGNLISISETHFFDLEQESLVQSASPKAMTIPLDSPGFYISSQSGVSLTFFNESVIDQLDKESEVSDDTKEDDKTTEENFSIVVSLNVGGKVYEKTIDVNESALKGSKTVDFNNLTVGLTAKASVIIYKGSSSDDKKIYAQGEGSEFVIQSGNNPTTIKIKKVVTDEKEPEVKPKPDKEDEDATFNFSIKGLDKNDVTDLNGNICKVHIYAVKDALLRTALNTTLDADLLTDDKKAEILIPIIEACQLTKITTFNPNNPSNNKEIVSVDDSGNILWKGDADLGLEDNTSYGVLATIYFSTAENSGFYECCVGYTDNLSYSSEKNKIEINVKNMDLPCNIYFYCDDKLDLQSTVRTAISDLRVLDKEGNIVDSVLTELYVASEEKIDALENDGYIADKDKEPVFSFMNGVPYVNFFYKTNTIDKEEEKQNTSAGLDVNLEESTSNVRVLELNTYGGNGVRNEDELGQQFTKVSIKDAPDLSGYTLIWKIDGIEEPERGTELNVYEALFPSGIHKVSLLAVNAEGTSFYEGETLISITRNLEERIVFISTDRGLEFRINRFTDDVSFEHVELKDEASGISVTTTFENSLSGWRGYWPFVEPNKEYTFILHGKIRDDTELVDRKLDPVIYKGNRNTPVTDFMKSYISSYKRTEKDLMLSSGATGYACVTYRQSSQKELSNIFREITDIEVTKSSLNFALFQVDNPAGWIWYMDNNYSSYGFIPEEMNEYDLIGNLPETDWGRNNALSHLENGVKILVTMYPAFVLNGDKNQYFKLPDLHSNTVEFSK